MFENREFLLLLLMIPILSIFFFFIYKRKKNLMLKFAEQNLLDIISSVKLSNYISKYMFLMLSVFFLIISLARPQFGSKTTTVSNKASTIVIVMDASKSMLAQDLKPNRLEKAKSVLSNLVVDFKGNKIGIITFAGTSFWKCPITTDVLSANNFLLSISVDDMPLGGTKIAKALDLALDGTADIPNGAKAIILVTDGEDDDSGLHVLLEKAKKYKTKIYTIGIGDSQGSRILYNNSYIKDDEGKDVISKLDENTLKYIADVTGGDYINLSESEDSVYRILQIANSLEKIKDESLKEIQRDEKYQVFLFVSLVFFCIYLFITVLVKKRSNK